MRSRVLLPATADHDDAPGPAFRARLDWMAAFETELPDVGLGRQRRGSMREPLCIHREIHARNLLGSPLPPEDDLARTRADSLFYSADDADQCLPACLACGQPTGMYCDGVAGAGGRRTCGRALCSRCDTRFQGVGPCCVRLQWPGAPRDG